MIISSKMVDFSELKMIDSHQMIDFPDLREIAIYNKVRKFPVIMLRLKDLHQMISCLSTEGDCVYTAEMRVTLSNVWW